VHLNSQEILVRAQSFPGNCHNPQKTRFTSNPEIFIVQKVLARTPCHHLRQAKHRVIVPWHDNGAAHSIHSWYPAAGRAIRSSSEQVERGKGDS
jgi:hypothetical protein